MVDTIIIYCNINIRLGWLPILQEFMLCQYGKIMQ